MLTEDSYRHKGLRNRLVEEIKSKGITDEGVLAAIGKVPRHLFMESGFVNFSYKDSAFPIGAGQTISQPYTVAFQTQLLKVKPMEKVLEIGTGSGYQTAILLEMGAKVFSIERQRELFVKSKALLEKMGYNPHLFYGDGYQGMPSYGPYSKILVTAGAPEIPQALVAQLEVGGRMVIPVGDNHGQNMVLVEKISETETKVSNNGRFIFVPLLKGTNS
ncbi:MAG TPA: protein-L-isoaspartate(D-aspartate) O-methyltransferase [Tenuifilaceae bacterium]|nr:protein-L-isoaspartate(D-aspartate) O-methyltransferase [Tenuifilaceae bacterium]HPE19408.1 protein-L-isoaspartate(D-aspartate) O-methyltransferase [Tenuifilaceae bacterium]HPJ46964.1 protein-L-isoaspartate(D-aspartate) O-methyltransferase [Tenuifilaceae bacterium]HRX69241.1 protein-L-isoaspartate(D-aspartate) O-methyltransferase [Tenuifilaceae bacterium]